MIRPEVDLCVTLGRIAMRNPIVTASGCSGYGEELGRFYDLALLGAIVTKSITLEPREGHPPPRLVETRAGMLNAIGLANVGLERFLAEKLPALAEHGVPVIVNVAGSTRDEYIQVAAALDAAPGRRGHRTERLVPERQGRRHGVRRRPAGPGAASLKPSANASRGPRSSSNSART